MAANYNYFWQGGGLLGSLYSPSSTVGPDQTYPGSQSTVQPNSVVSPEVYSALNPPVVSLTSLDIYLKVLSPSNKKEFKMYTLRKISRETVDTPNKLKDVICDQYGSVVGVDAQQMDVGYFYQAKKLWINNRLDMNDFWDVIERGDKLTLWCVQVDQTVTQSMPRKRSTGHDDNETGEAIKKSKPLKKGSIAEEKRPLLVIMRNS